MLNNQFGQVFHSNVFKIEYDLFKLAKIEGEFIWHNHPETDEVFIVIEGSMVIEFEEETVELNAGEMYVVPKGVMHKPHASKECKIMIVEPRGVINTGEADSELTSENDVWIWIFKQA